MATLEQYNAALARRDALIDRVNALLAQIEQSGIPEGFDLQPTHTDEGYREMTEGEGWKNPTARKIFEGQDIPTKFGGDIDWEAAAPRMMTNWAMSPVRMGGSIGDLLFEKVPDGVKRLIRALDIQPSLGDAEPPTKNLFEPDAAVGPIDKTQPKMPIGGAVASSTNAPPGPALGMHDVDKIGPSDEAVPKMTPVEPGIWDRLKDVFSGFTEEDKQALSEVGTELLNFAPPVMLYHIVTGYMKLGQPEPLRDIMNGAKWSELQEKYPDWAAQVDHIYRDAPMDALIAGHGKGIVERSPVGSRGRIARLEKYSKIDPNFRAPAPPFKVEDVQSGASKTFSSGKGAPPGFEPEAPFKVEGVKNIDFPDRENTIQKRGGWIEPMFPEGGEPPFPDRFQVKDVKNIDFPDRENTVQRGKWNEPLFSQGNEPTFPERFRIREVVNGTTPRWGEKSESWKEQDFPDVQNADGSWQSTKPTWRPRTLDDIPVRQAEQARRAVEAVKGPDTGYTLDGITLEDYKGTGYIVSVASKLFDGVKETLSPESLMELREKYFEVFSEFPDATIGTYRFKDGVRASADINVRFPRTEAGKRAAEALAQRLNNESYGETNKGGYEGSHPSGGTGELPKLSPREIIDLVKETESTHGIVKGDWIEALDARADVARANLKKMLQTGTHPGVGSINEGSTAVIKNLSALISDAATIGAAAIAHGIEHGKAWSEHMIERSGAWAQNHLPRIRKAAEKLLATHMKKFNDGRMTQADEIIRLINLGERGHHWYTEMPKFVEAYKEKSADMLAAFSWAQHNIKPGPGSAYVLQLYDDWVAGRPPRKGVGGLARKNLIDIIWEGKRPTPGPNAFKLADFYKANKGSLDEAVQDVWMGRIAGINKKLGIAPSGPLYKMLREYFMLALEKGVREGRIDPRVKPTPAQARSWVQAIWEDQGHEGPSQSAPTFKQIILSEVNKSRKFANAADQPLANQPHETIDLKRYAPTPGLKELKPGDKQVMTGVGGKEDARIAKGGAPDALNYYIGKETAPEWQVKSAAPHEYVVEGVLKESLYDRDADPLGFFKEYDFNGAERAVKETGHLGYRSENMGFARVFETLRPGDQSIPSKLEATEMVKKLNDAKARRALTKAEAAAKKRIEARLKSGTLTMGGLVDLSDYAIVLAAKMARKALDFKDATAEMVAEFGDTISPHMRKIYEQARSYLDLAQRGEPMDVKEPAKAETITPEVKAEPAPAAPKPKPEPPTEKPSDKVRSEQTGNIVDLRKEEGAAIRRRLGLDKLPEVERKSFPESWDQASREGLADKAIDIARSANEEGRAMTDAEHAGAVQKALELEDAIKDTRDRGYEAAKAGNDAGVVFEMSRSMSLLEEYNALTEAADLSGTAAGRSLSIRRLRGDLDTFDVAHILQEARKHKGSKLTERDVERFSEMGREMEELTRENKRLTAEEVKRQEEIAAKEASEVLEIETKKAGIREKATVAKEKILKERDQIKAELRKLGYRANVSVSLIPPDALYQIGRLAANYIKEGAVSLDEVARLVIADVPGLTKRDVYDALNTRNPKAQSRARSAAEKRVANIKRQARLMSQIEDIKNGIDTPTAKRPAGASSGEVRALQDTLRQLRHELYKGQIESARAERAIQQINKLQDQLDNHYREIKERRPGMSSPKLDGLTSKIEEIKRTIKSEDTLLDLEEQIRTGEYKVRPRRPRPVSPELEANQIKIQVARKKIRQAVSEMAKQSIGDKAVETIMASRTLMATADISATMRQALWLSARRPVKALKAQKMALEAMFNKYKAEKFENAIKSDPRYLEYQRAKLEFSETEGPALGREEYFRSRWVEKFPVWGEVIKGSERHMTTMLNVLRKEAFDQFLEAYPEATQAQKAKWADFVNVASGRGKMALTPNMAKALNTIFFAPKFAVSRFQTPTRIFKNLQDPILRKEIGKDIAATVGFGMTALALAYAAGAEVGYDPRDPDFGKIRVGDTRIDIWGGVQQPARLVARALYGAGDAWGLSGKDLTKQYKNFELYGAVEQFAAFKLSPLVTMSHDIAYRENVVGQKVTPLQTLSRGVMPLLISEVIDARKYGPGAMAATAAASGVGIGIGTYQDSERVTRKKLRDFKLKEDWDNFYKLKNKWNTDNPKNKIKGVDTKEEKEEE